MKLEKFDDGDLTLWHWCPACQQSHPLPGSWNFNGDMESPTFTPSFRQFMRHDHSLSCHYIITAGVIEYQSDSFHDMKGHMVPMPDMPDDWHKRMFQT